MATYAAAVFSISRRLTKGALCARHRLLLLCGTKESDERRLYSTEKRARSSLQSVLWPLGNPSINLVPEIERWIENGNNVRAVQIQHIIRELRARRRHRQALEISEWMKGQQKIPSTPSDHAVRLDLIGEVRGVDAAESYFNSLSEKDKTEKTYGALLNCYVRDRSVDKSLSQFQKMKEHGFAFSPLPYNDIMCLYTNIGQHEKVPSVLAEMKDNGIFPDNFSYRICMNSYGVKSDIYGMEQVLEEMEQQPQIVVDWNTYAVVANIYRKAGLVNKAKIYLTKAEERIDKKDGSAYNHLISMYCHLGDKSEMQRLWALQKKHSKKFINRDYTTMLWGLVKLGDLEEAEALLKEWESSPNALDFRVPNVLLGGYCKNGLLSKAEALIDNFLKKSKMPPSSSWGILAAAYVEKNNLEKAHEFMKHALSVYAPNTGWNPNPVIVKSILQFLGDNADPQEVETFIELLKAAMRMDLDMYHSLLRAHIRAERDVNEILKRMEADKIQQNEETEEILKSQKMS